MPIMFAVPSTLLRKVATVRIGLLLICATLALVGARATAVFQSNLYALQVARDYKSIQKMLPRLEDNCALLSQYGYIIPNDLLISERNPYLSGIAAMFSGNWIVMQEKMSQSGRSVLTNYQKGWGTWCAGDHSGAVNIWGQQADSVAGLFSTLARHWYSMTRFQEARSWAELSLAIDQHSMSALQLLGKLDESQGNWTLAAANYEAAIAIDPTNAEAQYYTANAQFHVKNYVSALAHVILAVQLTPQRWQYHALYGSVALKLEQWEAAESHLLVALEGAPNDCWSLLSLANAQARLQKLPASAETMQRAIRSCGDAGLIAYYYSVLAAAAQQFDDPGWVVAFYEQAVIFEPDSEGFRDALLKARIHFADAK